MSRVTKRNDKRSEYILHKPGVTRILERIKTKRWGYQSCVLKRVEKVPVGILKDI